MEPSRETMKVKHLLNATPEGKTIVDRIYGWIRHQQKRERSRKTTLAHVDTVKELRKR